MASKNEDKISPEELKAELDKQADEKEAAQAKDKTPEPAPSVTASVTESEDEPGVKRQTGW